MKNYILLSIIFLVYSCSPAPRIEDTSIYEESVIEFSNSEKITLHAYYCIPSSMTLKDNCEFFTITKELSGKRVLEAVFARHKNFSLSSNKDWYKRVGNAATGKNENYAVKNIDMTTQFFRVYTINVDKKDVYRNEEAISSTYWNTWLINSFNSDYYISISLKLDEKLEVQSKNILKTSEPENFYGLLNTGNYWWDM